MKKESNMKSRVWTKPNVQTALRSLRNVRDTDGNKIFSVVKKSDGFYEATSVKTNKIIFSAMIGTMGYLVRFDQRLFTRGGE